MPVTPYRHDEPITGEPHGIIKTPNPNYSGDKLKVIFRNGVGRSRSLAKLKRFSEEFDYEVTLAPGMPEWIEAKPDEPETAPVPEREHSVAVVEEYD